MLPAGLPVAGLTVFSCAEAVPKMCPQPARDVEHRDDDRQVDEGVLDERDQGRRAQSGQVGVGRHDPESDDQRQVPDHGVARGAAYAHHGEHRFDAHELQRDVGHGGQDPGHRHGEPEALRAVPAPDELAGGDVATRAGDRPEPRREDEHDREDHDRVCQCVEPRGPGGIDQRGHGDEGVGGVDVAAEQEPADERAESAAGQTPLVQLHRVLGRPPSGRGEADEGDDQERGEDDDERDRVQVVQFRAPLPSPGPASGVGLVLSSR